MRRPSVVLAELSLALSLAASVAEAQEGAHLPFAVTNNAVAAGRVGKEWWIFSALGVDESKKWSGITRRAAAWNSRSRKWSQLPDVPGRNGRLAATSQFVRGRWYVFGGYTVDSAGNERSVSAVDVYDPRSNRWKQGQAIPVAVDDAVSGVYRDSLVYLISGWHDTDNVQDVQLYDVVRDRWSRGTPIPGPGVFGHSGGLAGGTIVFVDGALRQAGAVKYRLHSQVWIGTINPSRPTDIAWTTGPAHPGVPLYRAATGECGSRVIFAGGTGNPYNYNGIGYDGVPSEPSAGVMAFDTARHAWISLPPLAVPTMDHRGLAIVEGKGFVVGGMRAAQHVDDSLVPVSLGSCSP